MRAPVVDAGGGQRVRDRGPRDAPAVASERVVALLVGGDEKNLATHRGVLRQTTDSEQMQAIEREN
jgi:hypothetical protein